MSEKMTAEQAWAEVDRLDVESDAACEISNEANRRANELVDRWSAARTRADSIGPRPAKVTS